MKLLQIFRLRKFIFVNILLFSYVMLNLLDGERGLISYIEKLNIKEQLLIEKKFVLNQLNIIEMKNNLLTNTIDLDYLETLYREKFMVGKPNEKIYKKFNDN